MLNPKQKAYLKSLAQKQKPVFQIGKDGLNENMLRDVLNYLNKHELMKVTILQNCPMDKEEYQVFYNELINAKRVPLHDFEKEIHFDACMPIESIAKGGFKSLTFGPMKPVGITPPDGSKPFAVVQLRQDNAIGDLYNIVGFQTNLLFGEQDRVFKMIPGLKNAKIYRYGVMHRNTYINAPKYLNKYMQLKENSNIFFAGQLSGVEGYIESAASAIVAAINAVRLLENRELIDEHEKSPEHLKAAEDAYIELRMCNEFQGKLKKCIMSILIVFIFGIIINLKEVSSSQYNEYLEYAKSEDLQFIISNTTEAGIALDPTDLDLTVTPKSYPGKLLAFLKARYEHFNGDYEKGLFIIPCELIDYNGAELKRVLVELAKIHNMDEKFIDWMVNANKYYNTLVDRIVPGYPRNEAQDLWNELGYVDQNMVVGEIFHLWCIDGEHVRELEKKLPTKEAGLNVLFVDSIKPYKERKVKILNGAHTCLVPVSYLSGIDAVRETIEDEQLGKFVKEFMLEEVVPTINIPHDQMVSYCNSVLERYENPFVHHLLMSIALNSVTKYKTRILPSVLQNLNDLNHFPDHALFSLASLITFYRGVRGEETIRLADDQWALDMFKELWANFDGSKEASYAIAKHVLSLEKHWEVDLTKYEGVLDYVADCIYEITSTSMREALAKMVK